MQTATVVALSLLCVGQTLGGIAPCDQDIIDAIYSYWDDNGVPENVLATLAKKGKGTLLYSTDDLPVKFPVDVPVDDPKCVNGEFTPESAKFTVVPKKGTLDASKATVLFKASEGSGIVSEDKGKVVKYIIYNKHAVTGFYTCKTQGGDSNAAPAAGVAVAIQKYQGAKKYIAALKSDLEVLGFDLQIAYDKECTK